MPTAPARTSPRLIPVRVRAVEGKKRTLKFVASTQGVARDRGIIDVKGWELENFQRNPVFLWAHDSWGLPIGRVVRVYVKGDDLIAEVEFAGIEQNHEFAETIFRLYKAGFLHAVSVGFDVLESRNVTDEERAAGAIWASARTELTELSAVPVPADVDAVAIERGVQVGGLTKSDVSVMRRAWRGIESWKALLEGMEGAMKREVTQTEDGMLQAILRPADTFDPDTLSEMEWPGADGVVCVVGKLAEGGEMAVQGVAFDAEAFDVETAQAWLEENEAALLDWSGDEEESEDDTDTEDEDRAEETDEDKEETGDAERALAVETADYLRTLAADLLARADEMDPDDEEDTEEDEDRKAVADLQRQIDSLKAEVQRLQGDTGAGGSSDRTDPKDDPDAEDPDEFGLLDKLEGLAGR